MGWGSKLSWRQSPVLVMVPYWRVWLFLIVLTWMTKVNEKPRTGICKIEHPETKHHIKEAWALRQNMWKVLLKIMPFIRSVGTLRNMAYIFTTGLYALTLFTWLENMVHRGMWGGEYI